MSYRENALKKIRAGVVSTGIDALLVTGQSDIIYLAGFYSEGAMLLIPKKGRAVYFIDRMNSALARKYLKGGNFDCVAKSSVGTIALAIKDLKIKRLGFDPGKLSVAAHDTLARILPGTRLVAKVKNAHVSSILKGVRKIKYPQEARIIRRAAKETVSIWNKVRRKIKVGISEQEIASYIDVYIKEAGYGNSFPTIAAVGSNTADPHAVPTTKKLKKNEHLLVDFGITYKGYCSDLTRIWYKGRIDRQIRDFVKYVRMARDKAIEAVKPGVSIGSLAGNANKLFRDNGLDKYVLHGLGHGVGVDVHEQPFLREESGERLKKGMVVTIEPGLYRAGLGGIREEDMVLVTSNGCEVLTV